MANNVTPYLPLDAGSGELDMALKFYGNVITAFHNTLGVSDLGMRQTINQGSSYQFPAIWKLTGAYHTPGASRRGANVPENVENIVTLDTKEFTTQYWLTKRDANIMHYDVGGVLANEIAMAIKYELDAKVLATIYNGAGQSARGGGSEFPAGVDINRVSGSATAPTHASTPVYAYSEAGSELLQSDIQQIATSFDTNNVPKTNRWLFLDSELVRVLRQDKTLQSSDFTNMNNLITRQFTMVEGFRVFETNFLPRAAMASGGSRGSTTVGHANYHVADAQLSFLAIGDASAFGLLEFGGIDAAGPNWHEEERSWFASGAHHSGANWLRPEACARVTWSTS